MNPFIIQKLDGRHTGHELFSHYINYNVYTRAVPYGAIPDNELNFLRARVWFWEKFGPSAELGKSGKMSSLGHWQKEGPKWAWQTEHNLLRIYVTEEALVFFTLTFPI